MMIPRYYRLTVLGCALSWFLVGLHLPALHQTTHHGRAPDWTVLAMLSFLTIVAIAGLWILLHAPVAWTKPSSSRAAAS